MLSTVDDTKLHTFRPKLDVTTISTCPRPFVHIRDSNQSRSCRHLTMTMTLQRQSKTSPASRYNLIFSPIHQPLSFVHRRSSRARLSPIKAQGRPETSSTAPAGRSRRRRAARCPCSPQLIPACLAELSCLHLEPLRLLGAIRSGSGRGFDRGGGPERCLCLCLIQAVEGEVELGWRWERRHWG